MHSNRLFFFRPRLSAALVAVTATVLLLPLSSQLFAAQQVTEPPYISGQSVTRGGLIQVALDGETGKTVFILTPKKTPQPTHTNAAAQAPIYLVAYPTTSDIPADHLDCTVTNCKGLNVLPFLDSDYGAASDAACAKFNGGKPCSAVEGHDHIVGTPFTGGDFNVAWHKVLVIFTTKGFDDDAIDTRITSVAQLEGLEANDEVKLIRVPASSFNCSLVPETVYDLGTPVTVVYP